MSAILVASAVLAAMGCANDALAWGAIGHATVCEIAVRELNDKARGQVIALMKLDTEFTTFSKACNWPDRPPKAKAGTFH